MGQQTTLLETFRQEFNLADDQVGRLRTSFFIEGQPLAEAFEAAEITDENRILRVLSKHLDLPLLDREDYPEKPVLLEGVSMSFLRKHAVLPIHVESGRVRVVVNDPLDLPVLNTLSGYFAGMKVNLCLGQREEIRTAIDRLYGTAAREAEALSKGGPGNGFNQDGYEEDLENLKVLAQEAPIVRLVNVLISRALDMRASDIHFEPFERAFQVRCRVDGVLFDLDQPPKTMQAAIISRLKLMANLNIAERASAPGREDQTAVRQPGSGRPRVDGPDHLRRKHRFEASCPGIRRVQPEHPGHGPASPGVHREYHRAPLRDNPGDRTDRFRAKPPPSTAF